LAQAEDTTLHGIGSESTGKVAPEAPATLRDLAALADVRFNGDRPWDIRVIDPRLYQRLLRQGSLGFGEAYMDGDWETERLDELFCRLLGANIDERIKGVAKLRYIGSYLRTALVNRQAPRRAFEVGERHYDIGNDVYEAMLDPTMSYSCAYWKEADNLADAQRAKLKLICDKLQLEPGQRLLDIGCGWGGLARYAAEHHDVEVVGITVSREQAALARERCRGLPVRIELKDYRSVEEQFDRVVSVGMFEHVGPKNYARYFATANRVMTDDGLFLLHTIGLHATRPTTDDWIEKYIFPNSKLPSPVQLSTGFEPYFILEDWHNFGQDYDRTLMAWWDNFQAAWPHLENTYGERFYRMWKYYLLCCAGFFRSRQGQLWQLVLSKRSRRKVYRSIR
jgi:cyclopropane-fatty-acyl-phospholipid synthase